MALQGNFRRTGRYRIYMNVGYVLDEAQLTRYFSRYGTVTDCYLPKHKSGRNKGFGFTTFETEEDLERALQSADHVIDGVMVKINRAGPRPEHEHSPDEKPQAATGATSPADVTPTSPSGGHGRGPRLYVGGVPDEITEEDIVEHFNKWGQVVDCYFPGKKGAKRVNYCFITFDNWRSAQRACNQSERNIYGKPLQSISMAEERQGEAHVDGLAKLSGMQAQAALQQALALANAPAAAASVAAANLGAYNGGFGQAPAAAQPANGLAALQALLANGLVAPNAVSSLIAALASNAEATPQTPVAPNILTEPGLAGAMPFQGQSLQGMTASDLNTLAALLAQQQDDGSIAPTSALGTPVAVSDPLASLDASIKGTLSPGNVSLLKPWGQRIPEPATTPRDASGSSTPTSPPGAASPVRAPTSTQGDEVESPLAPRRTSTLPVPGRSGSFEDALDITQRPRAASFDVLQQPRHAGLSAMPSHLPAGTQPYHAAASTLAGHLLPLRPAGPTQIRQTQIEAHNAAQMAMLQGMQAAGNPMLQADTLMQPAGPQQASALGLPFSPQPSTPIPPVAFNAFASTHPSACKPAPYRPYHAPNPGLQSMASSSDDGMRMAEGCFRLLAI